MGKKALLAGYFILLLRSQKLIRIFSIFTSSKFGSLKSGPEIKRVKNIRTINGFSS